MNVLKMLKISQPVTFTPHSPLYQLEASCGNLVRALIMIAATGKTVHTSLKYGHVDYTVCILNFISVKNSKYQL